RGVSSIWLRGSSLGSVERTSRSRPSRGCALAPRGNVTENDWAAAAAGKRKTRARAVRFMLATILAAALGHGICRSPNLQMPESLDPRKVLQLWNSLMIEQAAQEGNPTSCVPKN